MGQSGSAQLETLPTPAPVQVKPLPVKKIPPPRPASPPKRPRSPPKNPKYAVPENRVLPFGDPSQRKLRPVSQEISKVNPEFVVFQKRDIEDEIENGQEEEEAMDITEEGEKFSKSNEMIPRTVDGMDEQRDVSPVRDRQPNGVIPNGNAIPFRRSMSTDESVDTKPSESSLRRTHSLDRAPVRPKGHRRQSSRTTSLMNEQHTIFEDPRESLAETRDHLYDNWRKDPYTNAPSNVVSLPVRTNFDIDVTFNMTYAQLAEHRRQKNLEELQRKTGISVEQLQSDLTENSNIPYNPFERQGFRESTRSTSTASSDTGVSKRKKKRAPPPPGTKVEDFVDDEPPVDYDMDEPPMPPVIKMHQRRLSNASAVSNLSSKSKPAPPPPKAPPPQTSSTPLTLPSVDNDLLPAPTLLSSVDKDPQPAPTLLSSVDKEPQPAPTLLSSVDKEPQPAPTLSSTSLVPASSSSSSSSLSTSQSITPSPPQPSSESNDKASHEQVAINKLDKLLSVDNADSKSSDDSKPSDDSKASDDDKLSDDELAEEEKTVKTSSGVSSSETSPEKRLNSLVSTKSELDNDPDRVRVLKTKIPPLVFEKPKDESQLFREKLAQAYEERTKRREEELRKKEEEERKLKEKLAEQAKKEEEEEQANMSARSEKKHGESVEILRRLSRDLDKKWLSAHRSQSPEVMSSHETDDDLSSKECKSPGHRRVFSEDWTPEHDLDSDDDIEDRNTVYSHQRSTSEGFKSSILPTKFTELKKNNKTKYIRKQSDSSNDEKQKYGSIRKLKKTVHKGVKNAFGSISRASGKLLRKQRSMDFDADDAAPPPPPPPSNWQLSASTLQLNGDVQKVERRLSQGNILTSDEEDSESENESLAQPDPIPSYTDRLDPEVNGHIQQPVSSLQNGIRDAETPDETSRLYKKKKKKSGYLPNSKQSDQVAMESLMTEKIKEKQRQIEFEKQRQLDIEREMLRLQALEQEERYQRLQTAHFQQQLQVLQQSVAPGPTAISAPPLPPAGGFHSYSVPDFTSQAHHAYPHMMNQGLPQQAMSPGMAFGAGSGNQNIGNLTSFDINYLSNLMRMNGVQPPSSSQQWAYLLNSVSLPAQTGHAKSMYPGPEFQPNGHHVTSMYMTTSGPDLSKMFTGQSLDDTQLRTKKGMMDYLTARKQSQSFSNLTDHQMDPQMNNLLHDYERSTSMHIPPLSEKVKQRSNPVYYSSDEEDLSSGLSPARTSRNYVASVHVKDYRTLPNVQNGTADRFMSHGDGQGQMYSAYHVQTSPSHRQRSPGEDSSSSGADR